MVSSRKWEDQSRTKGGKIKMIHLFLSQSGFVRTKYTPPASKLCVIEPTAIKRRSYRKAERQPIRVASEGWNYPNIIAAELPRHVEVQDAPPVMTDHEEAVEHAERNRRDREEIHGCNDLPVVAEKGEPPFSWFVISRCAFHPTGDRSLREIKPEHEEFTMNARCSPGRVLGNHSKDEIASFLGNMLTANHSACPRDSTPVHRESCSMPADDRLRAHDDEGLLPLGPKTFRKNPEELVE